MNILLVLYAFISTIGFAVLFNIPRKQIVYSSLSGAIGWMLFLLINTGGTSKFIGTFAGAFVVGLLGEWFASLRKQPVTVFVVPGIIPLVPGYSLYYAMLKILAKQYQNAISVGFEAILIAIAISSGIMISSSVGKIIREGETKRTEFYKMNGIKY